MNTERANGVRTLWWVSATPPIDLSDVETIPDSQLDSSANEDDDISSCIRSGSPDTLSKEQVPPSPPQQDRDEDARPGRVARPQLVAPSSIEQVVSEVNEAVHNTASTESSADVDYAAATEAYLRERLRFRVRKRTTADEARYRFLPKGSGSMRATRPAPTNHRCRPADVPVPRRPALALRNGDERADADAGCIGGNVRRPI